MSFNNMVTSRHRAKSVRRRLFLQVFFSEAWMEMSSGSPAELSQQGGRHLG